MVHSNNGITFNNVKPSGIYLGINGPLTSKSKYKVDGEGNIIHREGDFLVNAIDIHWNGIVVGNTEINTTDDLINWISDTQIEGEQGPQGDKGDKGDQGEEGISGPQGEKGDTGTFDISTLENYATKDYVSGSISNEINNIQDTITTLSNRLDTLDNNGETLETLEKIKNELTNPDNADGLISFLDTVQSVLNNGGVQGDKGPQGPQGNMGTVGFQGNQGNKGSMGDQGNRGIQGSQGQQGNMGSNGFQGRQGNQGSQGNIGSAGPQGYRGAQGIQGNKGSQGLAGSIGIAGPQGVKGQQGYKGPQGEAGSFDASILSNYVTIDQYNALLARIVALENNNAGGEPVNPVETNDYLDLTTTKPTTSSITSINFPSETPSNPEILNLPEEITRPTELYLVYPSTWVTTDNNDNVTNPIITDSNGFAQGAWVDSTITVNGVSYTIIGVELGVDTFTITFN